MSSPLDGRIRALAREEATALLGVGTPVDGSTDADQAAALDLKVTELTVMVKRLDERLDALEKTAEQETRSATRRTRKVAE